MASQVGVDVWVHVVLRRRFEHALDGLELVVEQREASNVFCCVSNHRVGQRSGLPERGVFLHTLLYVVFSFHAGDLFGQPFVDAPFEGDPEVGVTESIRGHFL